MNCFGFFFVSDSPFGQLPILEIDGKAYAQTLPICHYLAKQMNLLGKSDLDALQIDAIAAGLYDLRKRKTQHVWNIFSDFIENTISRIIEGDKISDLNSLNDFSDNDNDILEFFFRLQ